jgi:hypothetical protein
MPRSGKGRRHHDRTQRKHFVGWAKARNAPCPRLSQSLVGFAIAPPTLQKSNKRKQNADRRGSPCFTLRRSAHPAQGALACRRSTAVLPKGLTHPLVRSRTRLRGANTMMAGISRRHRPRLQRAPRTPVIVPAGMMSETARARRRRTPARGHRVPLPTSHRHRPASLYVEREAGAFIPSVRRVKPNYGVGSIYLIPQTFCCVSFYGNATALFPRVPSKTMIRKSQ